MTFADGSNKEGTWQNGKYVEGSGKVTEALYKDIPKVPPNFTGKGKYSSSLLNPNDIYEGDYVNGKKQGKGKLTFENGNVYMIIILLQEKLFIQTEMFTKERLVLAVNLFLELQEK